MGRPPIVQGTLSPDALLKQPRVQPYLSGQSRKEQPARQCRVQFSVQPVGCTNGGAQQAAHRRRINVQWAGRHFHRATRTSANQLQAMLVGWKLPCSALATMVSPHFHRVNHWAAHLTLSVCVLALSSSKVKRHLYRCSHRAHLQSRRRWYLW